MRNKNEVVMEGSYLRILMMCGMLALLLCGGCWVFAWKHLRRRIDERLALARDSDYFALLGVGRAAGRAEVLRAHADLRDTFADERLEPRTREELADALAELHAALDEAREVLLDEVLRTAYLAQLPETEDT